MTTIYQRKLNINSKNRSNGTSSDFVVIEANFLNLFENPNQYKISMSVLNCVIPYSFFNINNNNNKFRLTESDSDGTTNLTFNDFVIPEGNYDAITYRNKVLELINDWVRDLPAVAFNYTFDFNRTTYTFTLTTTNLNKKFILSFNMESSAHLQFGFNKGSVVSAEYPVVSITSANVIQLSGDHQVYVKSTLASDSTKDHNVNGTALELISIPIEVPNFHLLIYKKTLQDEEIILQNTMIDNFHLYLTNQDNIPINLRGLDWELKLLFKVIKN